MILEHVHAHKLQIGKQSTNIKYPLPRLNKYNKLPPLSLCTLAQKEVKKFKEQPKLLKGQTEGQS